MHKMLTTALLLLALNILMFAQVGSGNWRTQYVTLDANANGTGYQTASVAAVEPNSFAALVTQSPPTNDIFLSIPGNYLVGYWNADSVTGRVNSPINGNSTQPLYGTSGQYTDWTSGLDQVTLNAAWQIAAGGPDNYVYVANNDDLHNILVFQLTASELVSTDYRMETGSENIYAIEVNDDGYVFVADYEGTDAKSNEIKVYAGIGAPGTTWGDFGGHNDTPVSTIDLPPGTYMGLTVNFDGSELFVSATSERSIWKYTGSPTGGYTRDFTFEYTLSEDDTIGNGGNGTPSVLGLGFINFPPTLVAAVDSFLHIGGTGGYPYGRIYIIDPVTGGGIDSADVAEWNLLQTGDYSSGSNNGLAGGYTSLTDVDGEDLEGVVYTQTYYGWAVEKWFGPVVGIEQIDNAIPQGFELQQNYPNPFNPSTTIEFSLRSVEDVQLEIFNLMGQKVATLVNERLQPGSYQATFEARDLPSGIYFYKLSAGSFKSVKKMSLIK